MLNFPVSLPGSEFFSFFWHWYGKCGKLVNLAINYFFPPETIPFFCRSRLNTQFAPTCPDMSGHVRTCPDMSIPGHCVPQTVESGMVYQQKWYAYHFEFFSADRINFFLTLPGKVSTLRATRGAVDARPRQLAQLAQQVRTALNFC